MYNDMILPRGTGREHIIDVCNRLPHFQPLGFSPNRLASSVLASILLLLFSCLRFSMANLLC